VGSSRRLRYVSEAWGAYTFNVNHGLMSTPNFRLYIGLFSYYNFDNWTYQRHMSLPIRHGSQRLSHTVFPPTS